MFYENGMVWYGMVWMQARHDVDGWIVDRCGWFGRRVGGVRVITEFTYAWLYHTIPYHTIPTIPYHTIPWLWTKALWAGMEEGGTELN